MIDVIIAGGGPVGALLALRVRECALSALRVKGAEPARDRPIALSWGSRLLLERAGSWPQIAPTAIAEIHVSQRGGFGRTLIRAQDCGLPVLGYVAAYRDVLRWLTKEGTPEIEGRVTNWQADPDGIEVGIDTGGAEIRERARLLVIADGGHADLQETEHDYAQHAIVADVATERPHRNVAWERFAPTGPIALLPYGERYALVWSTGSDAARSLLGIPEGEFLQHLGAAFGSRLGCFLEVRARAAFPLALRRRPILPGPRTVLIGNAAQTLHPVAGQGLNIGLRDACDLAEIVASADPRELGDAALLRRYARARRLDRGAGIAFTHSLATLFAGSSVPLGIARGAGLALLDVVPPARRFLARRMIFGTCAFP